MSRFPFRTPPKDPKAWKTHGFLTSPRWNLETAKATKPCKKRWFLNTTRRIHCKLQGTAPGPANRNRHEVSTRWSAAGAASVYNLRLPPKASGEDTGAGPAPGFKGCRPCRRPRKRMCHRIDINILQSFELSGFPRMQQNIGLASLKDHGCEGRRSHQIAPKKISSSTYSFWAAKTLDPPAWNTMAVKDEEATKSHQKTA